MMNRNQNVRLGSWRTLVAMLLAGLAAVAIMLVVTPAKSVAAEDDVQINEQTFPDPKFREWLLDENTLKGIGADGVLTKAERDDVIGIYAQTRGIKSIQGIEYFPNIITLNAEGNQISKVDLSKNPKLQVIYLRNNVLESIDFSHNPDLQFIEVFDNRLTSVDVSMLEKLKFLHIDYNRLKVLDLSHNLKLEGDGFVAANNPTLERIILPNLPNLKLDPGVFHEQDPIPGYKHIQWFSSENDQPINPKDAKFPFTGQTLYTKRIPNDYVVKYSAGSDQASGTVDDLSTVWDQDFKAPENGYTWENHEFQGWRLPNGKIVQPGDSLRNLAGKDDTGQVVTLRAVWKDLTPPKPSVPVKPKPSVPVKPKPSVPVKPKPSVPVTPNPTEDGSAGATPPNNPDPGAGNSGAPEDGNNGNPETGNSGVTEPGNSGAPEGGTGPETGKPGNNEGNGQPVGTENGGSGSNPAPGSAENGNAGAQPAQPTKPEIGTQPVAGEGGNTTKPQPSPVPGPAPAPGNSGDVNVQPEEPKPVKPEEPKPVKPNVADPSSAGMGLEGEGAASNNTGNGQPEAGDKTETQQPGIADKMSAKASAGQDAAAGQLAKTGSSTGLLAGFCTLLLSLGAVLRRLRFHR